MSRGLFRYDVMACESKVIPGGYGFVAQLNEGRHLKKRPTEFRVDRVLQPFDPAKFNFTRSARRRSCSASSPGKVSPIEYGYVLLIPRVLDCLPQRIDLDSFLLALHMAAEAGSLTLGSDKEELGWCSSDFSVFCTLQCYAEKQALGEVSQDLLDTQVNPAVWEISGHIVLKWKKDYDKASEYYAWKLLAEVSLSEARFAEVKAYILEATGLVESEEKMEPEDRKGAPYQSPNPSGHCYSSPQGCLILLKLATDTSAYLPRRLRAPKC
ncbi:hypothetical protein B296_00018399 [Ensete ventricosum]|uniref:GDP-D-glucose phosphorylase 1 n=1 Tax=Ensete ventricosum TaxID=4639 RepID=A0A427AAC7_ENSVE|nr:hypothetical protein B296_00018399 [Ensete ventricosum]